MNENMKEVYNFFKERGIFFVSTVDGDEPKVRPFSFIMIYEDKICFCTSNKKPFYAQLMKNPNIEMCASTDTDWVRLKGKAVFCTTEEAQAKALEIAPHLKNLYSVGDGVFEIFTIEEAVADFCSLGDGQTKTVNLYSV
ncbi:MAG: pyridoxamine 5'-phosphate oxidase family protein [Desulfitobacteriia bacterium]|jgi:uncharacterized pyridoxamine 5'-phosphate oxidase family protein